MKQSDRGGFGKKCAFLRWCPLLRKLDLYPVFIRVLQWAHCEDAELKAKDAELQAKDAELTAKDAESLEHMALDCLPAQKGHRPCLDMVGTCAVVAYNPNIHCQWLFQQFAPCLSVPFAGSF